MKNKISGLLLVAFMNVVAVPAACMAAADPDSTKIQRLDFHMQNTFVGQGDFGFPVKYSGPNSLNSKGEVQETATLDFFAGCRLWKGAEIKMDFLAWQGYGLSQTFGIVAFPNGDAYKAGTTIPNYTFAHLYIHQTIGLGEGKDLVFSFGRLSPMDICDNNSYAHDPHTQFLNWAMMGNLAWDYGENTVGYTTGLAAELKKPKWSLRYGCFQMPRNKNGFTGDDQLLTWPQQGAYGPLLRAWAMMWEFERRYSLKAHPGVIRFIYWLDEADFASYKIATDILLANPPDLNVGHGAGVTIPDAARGFHYKYGFGLNWEQEITANVGAFSRLGWNNGQYETWTFSDADWTSSLGIVIKGERWHRQSDAIGIATVISGASAPNQKFLKAGGTDMLSGDGNLNYRPEKILETYYDFRMWKVIHLTLDYQFVANPAFNNARGPVSIFGTRLNWQL